MRFEDNPIAWILAGLLAISVYGNFRTGAEFSHLCRLLGPHDVSYGKPRSAVEEIHTICADRLSEPVEYFNE